MSTCAFSSAFSTAFEVCDIAEPEPAEELVTTIGNVGFRLLPTRRFRLTAGPILIGVFGRGDISLESKLSGLLEIPPALSGRVRNDPGVAGEITAAIQPVAGVSVTRALAGEAHSAMASECAIMLHVVCVGAAKMRMTSQADVTVSMAVSGETMMLSRVDGEPWIANGEYAKALLGLPSDLTTLLN